MNCWYSSEGQALAWLNGPVVNPNQTGEGGGGGGCRRLPQVFECCT